MKYPLRWKVWSSLLRQPARFTISPAVKLTELPSAFRERWTLKPGRLYAGGAYLHLLEGKSIFEVLKDRCPLPMTIENDGKAAALAEAWKGNLKDCRDGVAIVLGTGIGGGLIKDGKIHRGKHFGAGEFSAIVTDGGTNIVMRAATYTCSTIDIRIGNGDEGCQKGSYVLYSDDGKSRSQCGTGAA